VQSLHKMQPAFWQENGHEKREQSLRQSASAGQLLHLSSMVRNEARASAGKRSFHTVAILELPRRTGDAGNTS